MQNILLVNEKHGERFRLAERLRKEIHCEIFEADSPAEGMNILKSEKVNLVLTDLFPPRMKGLELLKHIHKNNPEIVTLAGIPHEDHQAVVEVFNLGVFFYVHTPYDPTEALLAIGRALKYGDLLNKYADPAAAANHPILPCHGLIGTAPAIKELLQIIEKLADDGVSTVLIQGESGTGKELVAKAIHAQSSRNKNNFVPINCAAIPDELLESELFGYVKGAFTGANQSHTGRIQYADGGTLFLDEIGDMKPCLQAKLLRMLQEKTFEPVGGLKPIPVDVRVLAATHRDLEKEVEEGRFREDLYYRLNVVPITVPPLRERREDIPLLIEVFLRTFNRGKDKPLRGFSPKAMSALLSHPWPGNVRELENLVQRMVVLEGGHLVEVEDLPEKYTLHWDGGPQTLDPLAELPPELSLYLVGEDLDFNALVSEFEDRLILQALLKTGGNKKEAAQLLKLKRTTLLEKIKKKHISDPLCH